MLNWLCTFYVPWHRVEQKDGEWVNVDTNHLYATLVETDPRKAFARLKADDWGWRDGVMIHSRPVMQAPTPKGEIEFEFCNGI